MSVIRARRLGVCLLVVVLLLSVTVSASDNTVVLDETQFNTIWNEFDSIEADLDKIIPNVMALPDIRVRLQYIIDSLSDALFYNNGSVDLSVADLLQNIQVETEFIDSHLVHCSEKISSIDDALHMTITSSNGTSTTYDMASIVYNHIGDKLDRLYNKLDSQGTSSSDVLEKIRAAIVSQNQILTGTVQSRFFYLMQNVGGIRDNVSDIHDFLMNEEDLETKETAKEEQQTFNSEFGSKSRTDEMTKLSGLSTGMTDWFDLPDVDITSMFDQVESGYGRWFTSETAQAISVGGGSAAVAAAAGIAVVSDTEYVEPDTPYLDAWDQEVQDILAGGDGEW